MSDLFSSNNFSVGQEYYIKVWTGSSGGGTCQIAFNTTFIPPDTTITQLTVNTWVDGNLLTLSSQQWFKFTATARTQYIHVSFSTFYSYFYIQVYDSSGDVVVNQTSFSDSTRYVSMTVTEGQEYYIRVNNYSYSGTYRIAFNTSETPPP